MQDDVEDKPFAPVEINGADSRFLDYLTDFRVAIGASCFPVDQRPSNPRYAFPSPNDEPFYDCSSFPTFAGGVPAYFQDNGRTAIDINYGGAAVSRYTSVTDLELSVTKEEGIRVVIMSSSGSGSPAVVRDITNEASPIVIPGFRLHAEYFGLKNPF
jgi:hypothetical protein